MGRGQKVWLNDTAEYPLLDLVSLRFAQGEVHE